MSTITIHNKEYRIYEVTGKILESNKQRELHVYGSGGGGATYNGTGGTAPVNIQSSKLTKITKHAKRHFWLNDVCTCHGLLPSHSA